MKTMSIVSTTPTTCFFPIHFHSSFFPSLLRLSYSETVCVCVWVHQRTQRIAVSDRSLPVPMCLHRCRTHLPCVCYGVCGYIFILGVSISFNLHNGFNRRKVTERLHTLLDINFHHQIPCIN